ncbi:MAG: hypothetical protein Kow0090_12880 [Myxococcota bacterium]
MMRNRFILSVYFITFAAAMGVFVLLGVGLWGCGIFGDEAEPGGDDDDDNDDASVGGDCENGAKRCSGADAQLCLAGEWVTVKTCSSSAMCKEGVCLDQCAPQCEGLS